MGFMTTLRLKDKIAVVTGAGQGTGYAIAAQFAREGANVVVAEINLDTIHKAAAELCKLGAEAWAYPTVPALLTTTDPVFRHAARSSRP